MITIKLEGFSDTFPDWLKRTLERGRYAHTNGSNRNRQAKIDWNKAEYIP